MRAFDGMIVYRESPDVLSVAEVNSTLYGLECKDPSLAVQSQLAESDINEIVRRFGLTGQLPENVRVPTYGDFDVGVTDYQSALNAVREAEASFMQMPADVRLKFDNDPQRFLEFCADENNLDEMRRLGLAVPAKVVDTTPGPDAVVSDSDSPKE